MTTSTIVFYPSGGVGHLTPTVELAKLFIRHNFNATIVLIDTPSTTSSTITSITSAITSSNPSITFHHLPPLSSPSSPPPNPTHPLVQSFHLRRLNNPLLLSFLTTLSQSTTISALVLDFFCTAALDVAKQLQIPSYFFFSSNASNLSASLRLPTFLPKLPSPLKDLGDSPLHFPGLPPIPANHMPIHYQHPNSPTYPHFIALYEDMAQADGIIVNTFEALECRAVAALTDGQFPPSYCIGPLLLPPADEVRGRHVCLTWLDAQPKGSVVFLCFGSMGNFPEAQLKEIAVGLERSGQKFLWVVRTPKGEDPEKPVEAFLPEGFVERTEGRGMVVKSWAPQTAVLSHEAVGAFVTHCGWNSALEGVTFGVAMIAWPLYAEQWLNKVVLVEEVKVAVEMEGYDKEMVKGEEVEKKVRWVMESEVGKELKERVAAAKEEARKARMEGGSSDLAWKELVRVIKKD